ncbi:MAG: nucleotidyltransferase domain-containing protein [Candidatus Omnitrophica bacterium]|nr:nucleotidyltransferase domain-containing protein [Candidatus Omnitrophota bacterium]
MLKQTKTSQIISDIVKRIRKDCNPEKIVLFGSYAKGTPRYDSDIDLLVIKDSNLRRDERDKEIRRSLRDIKFPLDIFVYTPQEVAEYSHLKGSFISVIFKEGRVLYERD